MTNITKKIKEFLGKKELYGQNIISYSEEETLYLIKYLKKDNPRLESISIYDQSIKDEVIINFVEALKENVRVERVNLSHIKVSKKGMMDLIEGFKGNTTVKTLHLYILDNILDDEGGIAIAEVLRSKSILEELDLSTNDIGSKGAVAVAEALKRNRSLEYLHLRKNLIGSDGAIAIAEALRINKKLKWLDLAFNELGDEGAIALMEAFEESESLLYVNVRNGGIGGGDIDDKTLDRIYTINQTKQVNEEAEE